MNQVVKRVTQLPRERDEELLVEPGAERAAELVVKLVVEPNVELVADLVSELAVVPAMLY